MTVHVPLREPTEPSTEHSLLTAEVPDGRHHCPLSYSPGHLPWVLAAQQASPRGSACAMPSARAISFAVARCTATEMRCSTNVRHVRADQVVEVCANNAAKEEKFFQLMTQIKNEDAQALVFFETKRQCNDFARAFQSRGFAAAAMHGDIQQEQRTAYLNAFKQGSLKLLLATDVAQRGIDVKGCQYVVNYSEPKTAEDYIHRIGRTGRASLERIPMMLNSRSLGIQIAKF